MSQVKTVAILIMTISVDNDWKAQFKVFIQSSHCAICLLCACSCAQGTEVCKSHSTYLPLIRGNMSHATLHEETAQLLISTASNRSCFIYFCGWNHRPKREGRKLDYLEKTHEVKLQTLTHTKAHNFKPQPGIEPTLQHRCRSFLAKQMCEPCTMHLSLGIVFGIRP